MLLDDGQGAISARGENAMVDGIIAAGIDPTADGFRGDDLAGIKIEDHEGFVAAADKQAVVRGINRQAGRRGLRRQAPPGINGVGGGVDFYDLTFIFER